MEIVLRRYNRFVMNIRFNSKHWRPICVNEPLVDLVSLISALRVLRLTYISVVDLRPLYSSWIASRFVRNCLKSRDQPKFGFGFGTECHSKCTFGPPSEVRLRPQSTSWYSASAEYVCLAAECIANCIRLFGYCYWQSFCFWAIAVSWNFWRFLGFLLSSLIK